MPFHRVTGFILLVQRYNQIGFVSMNDPRNAFLLKPSGHSHERRYRPRSGRFHYLMHYWKRQTYLLTNFKPQDGHDVAMLL